jgi:hypothetical protein
MQDSTTPMAWPSRARNGRPGVACAVWHRNNTRRWKRHVARAMMHETKAWRGLSSPWCVQTPLVARSRARPTFPLISFVVRSLGPGHPSSPTNQLLHLISYSSDCMQQLAVAAASTSTHRVRSVLPEYSPIRTVRGLALG